MNVLSLENILIKLFYVVTYIDLLVCDMTNSAPLGRVGHRVAMSVWMSVCVSAPSGEVFLRPEIT